MPESNPPSPPRPSTPDPLNVNVNVVVEMVYYERSQPAARGRGKGQQKKLPPKIKDFQANISTGKDSWLSFLKQILVCHDEGKYRVSARKPYGIKVLVPPEKAKWVSIFLPYIISTIGRASTNYERHMIQNKSS